MYVTAADRSTLRCRACVREGRVSLWPIRNLRRQRFEPLSPRGETIAEMVPDRLPDALREVIARFPPGAEVVPATAAGGAVERGCQRKRRAAEDPPVGFQASAQLDLAFLEDFVPAGALGPMRSDWSSSFPSAALT